jgi:hypothetical protein
VRVSKSLFLALLFIRCQVHAGDFQGRVVGMGCRNRKGSKIMPILASNRVRTR